LSYKNYAVPWKGTAFNFVGYGSNVPLNVRNRIFALGNTYTFDPTLINELRYNFSRQFITTTNGVESYLNEFAAQDQVNEIMDPVKLPKTHFYPSSSFTVDMPVGSSLSFGPPAWSEIDQPSEAHTILDNVTKILGKHTLKTGFIADGGQAAGSFWQPHALERPAPLYLPVFPRGCFFKNVRRPEHLPRDEPEGSKEVFPWVGLYCRLYLV
jgi:hypothetical protein